MILNRIGDFSLLLAILVIFTKYKAVDYSTIALRVQLNLLFFVLKAFFG
jgi:NADH:ubiquinone oxidoreductase subunit 5 (subunit L)/multisubunit Na+/H+ antiporter MnhA subunit